jgi:hypothetical protein
METIDFIGVGAGRAGTTWIGKMLESHPDILFSSQKSHKELYFFNGNYSRKYEPDLDSRYHLGVDWYLSQFPPPEKEKPRGEFCPAYLFDPYAYKRINKIFPKVKIIIIIRNPVNRLFSIYWYSKAAVVTKLPDTFDIFARDTQFTSKYKYCKHVKKYLTTFGQQQVHIIIFDDILNKTESVLQNLYRFLKVDETFVPENYKNTVNTSVQTKNVIIKKIGYEFYQALKKTGLKSLLQPVFFNKKMFRIYRRLNTKQFSKPKMNKEVMKYLVNFYKKDISCLERLIGKDLSAWKQ